MFTSPPYDGKCTFTRWSKSIALGSVAGPATVPTSPIESFLLPLECTIFETTLSPTEYAPLGAATACLAGRSDPPACSHHCRTMGSAHALAGRKHQHSDRVASRGECRCPWACLRSRYCTNTAPVAVAPHFATNAGSVGASRHLQH
jgi:hypothetical protein